MESIQQFKQKLALLESMLNKMKSSTTRVRELKRSVYVLKELLKNQESLKSPYGKVSTIVRFSLQ